MAGTPGEARQLLAVREYDGWIIDVVLAACAERICRRRARSGLGRSIRSSSTDGIAHLQRIVTLEAAMGDMAAAVTRLSDEMRSFKDEMRSFKDEMGDFKDEMRRDRRDLSRQLGEIANAQGRLVEDIVAPSMPRLLRAVLGVPADAPIAPFGVRLRLRHPTEPGVMREFDVVAAHGGVALVVEVKSRLAPEGVAALAASLESAHAYLAPLGVREVIGAVATLYPDPSVIAQATRLGVLVFGVGEELMELKSPAGFTPRRV